jgi:hypothetical protein
LGEALMDRDSPPYFVHNAKDALAGLVAAHQAAYGRMPALKELLVYLRHPPSRQDLLAELKLTGHREDSDEAADVRRLDQLAESKNDVLGTLDTALTPLARGEIAALLATDDSGYRLDALLQHGTRVRFVLPVADHPRLAPLLGRLVLAQFTDTVLSPSCNQALLKMVIVDEAENFVTPTIAKGMAMARANRGSYVLAFQNLSQIPDPTLREDLLSVAGNKIVMPGVGDFDSTKFSALFGTIEREYISQARSQSTGTQTSRSSGSGRQGGGLLGPTGGPHYQTSRAASATTSETTGATSQFRLRATWLPGEIRALPKHHAIIERRDNSGEVTPPTLVHLDRALVTATEEDQQYQLYRVTGRTEGPRTLPVSLVPGRTGPAAPVNGERPPLPASPLPPPAGHATGNETGPPGAGPPAPTPEDQETPAAITDGAPAPTAPAAAPDATALPEWATPLSQAITAQLSIDPATAAALVARAHRQGRGPTYLEDLLAYVRQDRRGLNPAATFQRLVETNAVRRPAPPAPAALPDEAAGNGA